MIERAHTDLAGLVRKAVYSDCENYRYSLEIELDKAWATSGKPKRVLWCACNPSTATELRNDPSVTRMCIFAAKFGANITEVVNAFGYRATDPREMRRAADPIGPDNDAYILAAAERADIAIAAWGIHGDYLERGADVYQLLRSKIDVVYRLRDPEKPDRPDFAGHPLYLPGRCVAAPLILGVDAAKPQEG